MDPRTFEKFRTLIYQRSGIALNEGKETLVAARLGKRMRLLGLADYKDYYQYVLDHEDQGEVSLLLDAISTNFTSFFREPDHFDLLREQAQQWVASGQQRLRIWSAACATGEEPYTMAIVLQEVCQGYDCDLRILATDISVRALERAHAGVYDLERIEPIAPELRRRYLEEVRGEDGVLYRVRDELRALVTFKRLNLSKPPLPMRGPLDIIFCRNVMIYFDKPTQYAILKKFVPLLREEGLLFAGHSESFLHAADLFHSLGRTVYERADHGGRARI